MHLEHCGIDAETRRCGKYAGPDLLAARSGPRTHVRHPRGNGSPLRGSATAIGGCGLAVDGDPVLRDGIIDADP
ncbi:hypothetical protein ACLBYD_27725 [Rhodococcus sp. C26F]